MSTLTEKNKEIKIIEDVDVIIVGGGPAGVAAATTAAENGLSTVIIEKNGFFGGANVSGMSGTIGGLYNSPSEGEFEQIVKGFAGKFYDELIRKNGVVQAYPFGGTALCPFNPLKWKETADDFVLSSGAKVYFHTLFVDVIKNEETIEAIVVETKEGRFAMKAKVVIDCSGDGNVAFRAGVPFSFGDNGIVQATTMVFRLCNVNWEEFEKLTQQEIEAIVDKANNTGKYKLPRRHLFIFPQPIEGEGLMNITRILKEDGNAANAGIISDLTYSEFEGRKQIREYERFLREYMPGFENSYIIESSCEVGIRQTRTIECLYRLKNEDVINARKFDTAIARSSWPIEVHMTSGTKVHTLFDNYYEIPFETMIPVKMDNLIIAGRCICAEHEALASCRVVAQCMEEGFAAAFAAKTSIEENTTIKNIDVCKIQELMRQNGSLI